MIEQKQLEGLMFRTAKRKETGTDDKRKVTNIPIERPLRVADILTETDHGSYVTIVTKDGRKYNIPISAKTSGGKDKESDSGKDKNKTSGAAAPGAGSKEE